MAERKNKRFELDERGHWHEVDLDAEKCEVIRKWEEEQAETDARLLREGPAAIPSVKLTSREKLCQDRCNAFVLGTWHAIAERLTRSGLEVRDWPRGFARSPSEFPRTWTPVILDGRFEVNPDQINSATLDGLKRAVESIYYEALRKVGDSIKGQVLAVARRPMVFYGWEDARENSEVAIMFRSAIIPASVYLLAGPEVARP